MAELQRLIYRSIATGATDSLLNVATILGESQRNNDRDGLTGALAAHRDRYIQVIEGPAAALDGLLRRLEADGRHKTLEVIERRAVDRRRFAGWAMAHARVDPETSTALERLVDQVGAAPGEIVALLERAVAGTKA